MKIIHKIDYQQINYLHVEKSVTPLLDKKRNTMAHKTPEPCANVCHFNKSDTHSLMYQKVSDMLSFTTWFLSILSILLSLL